METAVVYYSFAGNTAFICDEVAKVLGTKSFAVETKKEMGPGFMGYLLAGKQMLFGEIPEIEDLNFNPDDYDKIVLGAPCWAQTIAPAMKAFLKKYPLKNKEVALLLCHGGGGSEKTLNNWASFLDSSNKIVAKLKLVNPLKVQTARAMSFAAGWAEDLWKETT